MDWNIFRPGELLQPVIPEQICFVAMAGQHVVNVLNSAAGLIHRHHLGARP